MQILGVDTGGTFTDFVLFDGKELKIHKVLSTPDNPARVIFNGIEVLIKKESCKQLKIVHGTTVATNALLERKGADVVLITTKGYEDVLEIGRQARGNLYDLFIKRAPIIVEKKNRWGVAEQISSDGKVIQKVKPEDIEKIKLRLEKSKTSSAAICFLFSYKNPTNEQIVFDALNSENIHLSASHQILPEYREYERFITTVVNAYVSPTLSGYLLTLETGLKKLEINDIRIMQSNGGSISTSFAKEHGVNCVLSGPAGGVIGALNISKKTGIKNIITFDMGGTSTDVSLCDGKMRLSTETLIGEIPIKIPVIDILTVGAGGGSIAHLDQGGALTVGPQSAGADPGPVCYGKGKQITVTDANLFLGRISPDFFLCGNMELHTKMVNTAFDDLAKELKMPPLKIAEGIIKVANSNMERAIKVISIERGYDVRDFALFSFGGAGGLHACEIAASLSINKIVIPENAGVLSALGMALAHIIKDYSSAALIKVTNSDFVKLLQMAEPLVRQATNDLINDGVSKNHIKVEVSLDMRYIGQSFELNLPLNNNFIENFHKLHNKMYEYFNSDYEVEVVNIRVRGVGKTKQPDLKKVVRKSGALADAFISKSNSFYENSWVGIDIYKRDLIPFHTQIKTPALIVEDTATTFLPPQHVCIVDDYGNLIIERG